MKKATDRRGFIQKAVALSSGLMIFPRASFSEKAVQKKTNPIKKIKPLGFQWETQDPFLFCVHHEDNFPKGNAEMEPAASLQGREIGQDFMLKDGWRMYHGKTVPGFPGHPHRGFETITVVRKGMVDHSDSMGASGRYGNGDVQWMTAGKGVMHAEMFPLIHRDRKNPLELFQIWLNLPRKNKMVEPHFKMLWNEGLPVKTFTDSTGGKTKVEVVCGRLANLQAPMPPPNSWAADPQNEVSIWNIRMSPNSSWLLPKANSGLNRSIYFYQGEELQLGDQKLPHYHAADIDSGQDIPLKSGKDESYMLLLQGRPIDEPVVQHGPFVMNSKAEIRQAFQDYQSTQFGGWPWKRMDPVHPREKGRFAIHANGKKEFKS